MKNGTMTKNLGDGLLIVGVIFAIVLLAIAFVGFEEGGYYIEHPKTEALVDVVELFDDPYNQSTLRVLIGFLAAAILGFTTRRRPYISLLASLLLLGMCLGEAASGLFGYVDFPFTLVSAISIAANVTYTACFYLEKAEEKRANTDK